jgi:hypothetical protein
MMHVYISLDAILVGIVFLLVYVGIPLIINYLLTRDSMKLVTGLLLVILSLFIMVIGIGANVLDFANAFGSLETAMVTLVFLGIGIAINLVLIYRVPKGWRAFTIGILLCGLTMFILPLTIPLA